MARWLPVAFVRLEARSTLRCRGRDDERAWVEANLKAEEMLGALEKAFAIVGDEIDSTQRNSIDELAKRPRPWKH